MCSDRLRRCDANQHTEHAIVFTRIGHSVEVAAGEKSLGALALKVADDVAERIDAHLHACALHVAANEGVHALHRL